MSRKLHASHGSSAQRRKSYLNPFFLFLAEFREHLKRMGQRYKCTEETKLAGKQWRQMSASDKLIYVTWAKKNRQIKYHQRGKTERYSKNLDKVKVLLAPAENAFVSSSMAALKASTSMSKAANSLLVTHRSGHIQKPTNFGRSPQAALPEMRRPKVPKQTNVSSLPRPRDPNRLSRMDTHVRWLNISRSKTKK